MRRGTQLGSDSFEFQTAVARAHNTPAPPSNSNAALLSDAATLERLRSLFAQYDAGGVPLDAFRARIAGLGFFETPEASRVLQQLPLTFTALQRALKSGNEALAAPDALFGAASRDVAGPYHTSRLSNILSDSRAGPAQKGREDVGSGSRESGAGALLRGQGGALPRGATQREPGERGAALSEHTQHARVTHPSALVEAGAGALLRGEGASLHPRAADTAWERARQVLALVDGGGLRRGDAEARLKELGLTPATAPALTAAVKGYYDTGRLDMRGAMAAVSDALREAAAGAGAGARSFTADAEVAPLTAGARRGLSWGGDGGGGDSDIFGATGAAPAAPTHARAIGPEGAALRARILGGSPEPRNLLSVPTRRALDGLAQGLAETTLRGGGSGSNEAQWSAVPAALAREMAPHSGMRAGAQDPTRTRALGYSAGAAPAPFHTTDGAPWERGLGGPQLPGVGRAKNRREMGATWSAPDLSK